MYQDDGCDLWSPLPPGSHLEYIDGPRKGERGRDVIAVRVSRYNPAEAEFIGAGGDVFGLGPTLIVVIGR